MARGVGLSQTGGGGGGGVGYFWGGDVPLEPLAYTRPGADQTNFQFFLPTIHLFITHLFGFL